MLYSLFSFIKALFEITLIAAAFYFIYLWIRGTRAIQVLNGFLILFLVFVVARFMGLDAICWLLEKVFAISIVALLILFQPELRRALAQLGRRPLFRSHSSENHSLQAVVKAADILSRSRTGALIAIEQDIGLGSYIQSGVRLEARATPELLVSVFQPRSLLHDGGVILAADRIAAAGCVFPLSPRHAGDKKTGTRHQAALGLSEETDALVVVVSEETGKISVAKGGILSQDLTSEALARALLKEKENETVELASAAQA